MAFVSIGEVAMAIIRSWSYDRAEVSDATGLKCEDPSMTVQSQKDEADINCIVRNFGVTGKLPAAVRAPSYGDFTGVEDYRDAIHAIREAEASFMALPAEFRARLENDPQKFLEYCADSGNLEEMRKLGLAPPAPVPSASEAS